MALGKVIPPLQPTVMRYADPIPVKMKVDSHFAWESFGDVNIRIERDGVTVKALVPIRVFNKEEESVIGTAWGQQIDTGLIFVSFPPTQDGAETVLVLEDWLEKVSDKAEAR